MDAELVNKVVQQVLAALKTQGIAAPDAPQMAQKAAVANPQPPAAGAKRDLTPSYLVPKPQRMKRVSVAAEPRRPAKVFITADALRQRLAGAADGSVELAANEVLTPNALDFADLRKVRITRASKTTSNAQKPVAGAVVNKPADRNPSASNANIPQSASSSPASACVGLVVDRADAKVEGLLGSLAYESFAVQRFDQTDCVMQNLIAMCDAVAAGTLCCGVAVVPYAAEAMVLAGKIRGVRAVQGTRPDSVSAAVRRYNANVLVLEHAFSTFHEMRSMVRAFALNRPLGATHAAMMQRVRELEERR